MCAIKVVEIVEATVGGIREQIRQIAENIDRERFDLTLVCSTHRDPGYAGELARHAAAGISVIEVPMVRAIRPWQDFRCYRAIRRILAGQRFDVIHTHGSKAGFIGREAAAGGGSYVIHTGHTFPIQWARGLKKPFYAALERKACRHTDCPVALTEAQKQQLIDDAICPAAKIVVVPNAAELPPAPSPEACRAARMKLGLPLGVPVAGMVGRMVLQKDPFVFLAAARAAVQLNPRIHFVWVGGGPLRRAVEVMIRNWDLPAENIHLAGDRPDARELYAAFDVLFFTTRWEGMPYAVLEAMAAGLPVVAADVPGMREIVEHGVTGYVLPREQLAARLARLIADEDRRKAFGDAARERIRQRHSVRQFIIRLQELYIAGAAKAATSDGRSATT